MNVSRIDISEYARNRRRLRLLPNVLDYLLAYSLSRPIMKAGETIALVSRPELVPILGTTPVQAYRTVFDAWGMPGVAIVYGLYMVLYIGLNLWLFGVLKTSVRSDRSREMWLYIGLCIVFALWFGARFGVLAGAILGVPILLFAWLLLRHRRRLSPIGEDPIFRHLVGVSRRSFAYASTRFAFYSAESVKVYWSISRHALRIVLTICLLAVLVFPFSHYRIMRRADLESPLASMMDTFMGGSSAWLLIIVFVILVNWGRNAVARAIYRMLADVRRKVAVTASQIAQRDLRDAEEALDEARALEMEG